MFSPSRFHNDVVEHLDNAVGRFAEWIVPLVVVCAACVALLWACGS